ncbi:MAG: LCP family protein [Clostridia bacterium]|nr:LCP family protein [Clostridia bacterium]
MNVKKYLLIVTCTTLIFAIFSAGIIFFYSRFGGGVNMPDGTVDKHVKGLEEVEKSKPYNILVLGVDVEAKLTDVMMLCQIDPVDHQVNMLSIPRDTRIKLSDRNMKINSSFSHGGVEQVITCVKELTGLPVHHYFLIDTDAFRDTIDALGGVYFTVPRKMDYEDPLQNLYIHLERGYQLLDGDKAEQLVRFRRYTNGDIDRIKVQQDFIKELIEQKLTAAYILKIPEVYSIVEKNSSTDMTRREMIDAGKQLLAVKDSEKFKSFTVPGEGQYIGEVSYYVPYKDDLKTLVETEFK